MPPKMSVTDWEYFVIKYLYIKNSIVLNQSSRRKIAKHVFHKVPGDHYKNFEL